MTRGSKKGTCRVLDHSKSFDVVEDFAPNGISLRRKRKERLEYDTTPAKTVLAVVGVAVAIVLIWLESKGY